MSIHQSVPQATITSCMKLVLSLFFVGSALLIGSLALVDQLGALR